MSGSIGAPASSTVGGGAFASVGVGGSLGPILSKLLLSDEIEPGSPPSYELCKTIYSYHPLGSKLADGPITLAQSQQRDIEVPVLGEERIVAQFQRAWDSLGGIGATVLIHDVAKTARIYGIASLAVGEVGREPASPIDFNNLDTESLYFNVLDPLNTSGSLVLVQDPNSPDFLKPGSVAVSGVPYHPSRVCVMMNERPLYIEWSNSAFGFVGRSVYQRCLYPLKTYLQSMITDQMVTQKAGLLVAKMKAPGSVIDNMMRAMFARKRGVLKSGTTGQVVSIGIDESVETLNMQNLEAAARFARDNMLKNIATGANMPALLVNQETFVGGFGEGTEDAKQVARYIDYVRVDMQKIYDFVDRLVQHCAWTEPFYETLQRHYPEEYGRVPYERAFMEWRNAFKATWPNLLVEPDSEKIKVDDVRFKSAVALGEITLPYLDPENRARMLMWMTDNANARENLFAGKLELNEESLRNYTPPVKPEGPRMPLAFESET